MEKAGTRIKHVWRNVRVGDDENGNPVFDRVKVQVLKPGQIPPEPPDMGTLPPIENPRPPSNESTLRPPKDIGIPKWQEKDLED